LLFFLLAAFAFCPFLVSLIRGRLNAVFSVFLYFAAVFAAALMALVITFNCHCKVFASHQKWQRLQRLLDWPDWP